MRLVVLGDLHFYQLGVWPLQLFSKRLLGQTNLWINRRRHFQPALWPSLAERVQELNPDGLLGSGDFTTTALPGEFRQAANRWKALVKNLALPAGSHVVPGNHDRYTFASKRQRLFEDAFAPWTSNTWPRVWTMADHVTVVGLDPTRPNRFNASGELGAEQLEHFVKALKEVPTSSAILVLCHYPIGTPSTMTEEAHGHGLQDKQALTTVMAESGRNITYLHGHIHWPWLWTPPSAPNVTTVNVGAPMLVGSRYPHGQGFAELLIDPSDLAVTVIRHCRDAEGRWQSTAE